jgi:RNA polymerase sigma-70 factor (ECF subfamily)
VSAPNLDDVIQASDDELVELIKLGDHEAFSRLYDRYFQRIYNFVARRLNNSADAEETVQEVFINVFSSLTTFRGEASFSAWIFGVTRRTISSRFKKKRLSTVSIHDEEHEDTQGDSAHAPLAPTPIETIEYKQRVSSLDRLVKNRLTTEQRTLFELHHLQERPIRDIARTLKKSENSVKSNLYRARKILMAY